MSMSSSDDDVIIRKALPVDFDAVMSLGEMYSGRDYLMALYLPLLDDSDTFAVVATVNGSVVGFYMTTLFDGGLTVMKRAARVHKSFRGRGIFHMMEEVLDEHTWKCRPYALYGTIANTDGEDHLADSFLKKGYKPVYRKGVVNMIVRSSDVSRILETIDKYGSTQPVDVREVTHGDLSLLFQAERAAPRVFPKGRLFNFYLGYRLLDVNISSLLCKRGGAFLSLENTTEPSPSERFQHGISSEKTAARHGPSPHGRVIRETACNSHWLDPVSVHHVAMVTFYYCFQTCSGFLCFVDVYSRPGVPRDYFTQHLIHNLKTLPRFFPGQDFVLTLTHDLHTPRESILSCLTELGIVDELPNQEKYQVLYETQRDNS